MSRAPFCRDCLNLAASPLAERCGACGSPRLLRHKERDTLSIAHVDCDAFFAAVEKRDDPSLADKPVIIGGGKRGVVSTACYVARTYGVRSAMPMFQALKLCPHAVVIPPNGEKYRKAGYEVRELMLELTPLVEPVSIDEAFLDLTGTERLHHGSPALTLARFAHKVEKEIGITISVGLSYNKFLAKIASDFQKPRGFSIIGREEAPGFLADKPVGIIPGIGASAQARLAKVGVTQIAHLRDVPLKTLFEALGRDAQRLSRLAWGEDTRRVTPERETKSISAETTFDADLKSFDDLEPILWRLSEKVSRRLKAAGLAGRSVTLKLKDRDFRLLTRTRSGLPATQLAARLFEPARQLLKTSCDGTAYRLIGIGAADLCDAAEADKGDLADQSVIKQAQMESAIDKIRDKFGAAALQKGIALRNKPQR
ncbi:DNA polymerase IV [Microvirga sp. KLBC 81]|uniref:DNA polymerase IV n=1 Tax=Microvirga sp. KLBC 81 TaxID=1862707 RepID=UPI000D513731|nr:DNA polymerase IV [Microvirga sp. KLBC 81]PVE22320.1 DNA polymerase IV [Microvirga sp. KLBC 81]